jgi:acetyl-CoA C-acetyltransferase
VVHAVEAVSAGYIDLVVAGGTESMSNAPFFLKGARWGYRMGNAEVVDSMLQEGLTCAIKGCHMGNTAEEIVTRYNVSRADQDTFAAESQRRAEEAINAGRFDREIVAVEVPQRKGAPARITRDEYPRAGTTAEKLGALRPAFAKHGTVTAGNSSGINDGAAALLVTTGRKARDSGRTPMARVLSYCTTGVDPMIMGMGPVEAMRKAARRADLALDALDVIELNEAFAAQVIPIMAECDIPLDKMNPHGGAIALGHPFGMTGARIMTTLLNGLETDDKTIGLETMCVAGGQGQAMIVERLN